MVRRNVQARRRRSRPLLGIAYVSNGKSLAADFVSCCWQSSKANKIIELARTLTLLFQQQQQQLLLFLNEQRRFIKANDLLPLPRECFKFERIPRAKKWEEQVLWQQTKAQREPIQQQQQLPATCWRHLLPLLLPASEALNPPKREKFLAAKDQLARKFKGANPINQCLLRLRKIIWFFPLATNETTALASKREELHFRREKETNSRSKQIISARVVDELELVSCKLLSAQIRRHRLRRMIESGCDGQTRSRTKTGDDDELAGRSISGQTDFEPATRSAAAAANRPSTRIRKLEPLCLCVRLWRDN